MLGLFGTLNLGARALQAQQTGVEVSGQNLANVNNPAYARQRVQIQTSITTPSLVGPQGTGSQVIAIEQLRNLLLDGQIRTETSVGGYWLAQQSALQNAQAGLGEFLDRNADSVDGTATAGGAGAAHGLADEIGGLFNAFQSVSVSPRTIAERQALLSQAQSLATRFNQISNHLAGLGVTLDSALASDVGSANELITAIASLNEEIARAEFTTSGGKANDLRDLREEKLEALSKLVDIQTGADPDGTSVNVTIGGVQVVANRQVLDTLETYDAGGGQILVRTVTSATPLTLAGGSMQGAIDARDITLQNLQTSLDTLAGTLIAQVNAVHSAGFSLQNTTGAAFFTGADAATIAVNAALLGQPDLVQASGVSGNPDDNSVALALAALQRQLNPGLNNQTFSDAYGQIVGDFGNSLKTANDQLADHNAVSGLLLKQRDSLSGVSIDEEMTNLMTYQRAYQASARIVTTVDTMLETVLAMKR
jgi:flagellar hook-associated protein 1